MSMYEYLEIEKIKERLDLVEYIIEKNIEKKNLEMMIDKPIVNQTKRGV